MNTHADRLRGMAELIAEGRLLGQISIQVLHLAADYIEAHDRLANECRRKVEVQTTLRVEAQARAGRLAREARR